MKLHPFPVIGFLGLLAYVLRMHEMSLAASLVDIILEEMRKSGASRLVCAHVRHGSLSNVVPGALSLGFEVMTKGTALEAARLEMEEEALVLSCGACAGEFSPPPLATALFAPCPVCGEEIGHTVLAGKTLYLDHIEVE